MLKDLCIPTYNGHVGAYARLVAPTFFKNEKGNHKGLPLLEKDNHKGEEKGNHKGLPLLGITF
jgi:hypothetical protein